MQQAPDEADEMEGARPTWLDHRALVELKSLKSRARRCLCRTAAALRRRHPSRGAALLTLLTLLVAGS